MSWSKRLLLIGLLVAAAWQLVRCQYVEEERQVRSELRQAAEQAFPQAAQASRQRFSLRRLHHPQPAKAEVLLVHGLDDPGKVWMNMGPALAAQGYGVSVLDYPNDQGIEASARFMTEQLQRLKQDGVDEIILVVHSMGGLVSREMLTNPQLACVARDMACPKVSDLIMIGTPNKGSNLARFRGLGELREQFSRLLHAQAGWLDWLFDGAGEAGLDLLPDSAFLRRLNSRAHPVGVRYAVIAGVVADPVFQSLSTWWSSEDSLHNWVDTSAEELGDGLVSLESARIEGVPFYRVSGNHLSIVRNVFQHSERVPPAVPIVLRLLQQGGLPMAPRPQSLPPSTEPLATR